MSPDKRLSDSNVLGNEVHTFVGRCCMRPLTGTNMVSDITENSNDSHDASSHLS
jgi:hypothetical protein